MNNSNFPQLVRPLEHLSAHTPLRVGGQCLAWIEVYSEPQLREIMVFLQKNTIRWKVHWPFQDWLALDDGFDGVIVRLSGNFSEITQDDQGLTLGSAALFSSVKRLESWGHFFDGWSGTPGGLWSTQQKHLLKGISFEMYWIRKSSSGMIETDANNDLPDLPTNSVMSKIVLKGTFNRKNYRRPNRNGQIFIDKKTGKCAAQLLETHQLGGTRLRNWTISQHPPGRIIHFTSPIRTICQESVLSQFNPDIVLPPQSGTESADLLELSKAIAQRIKRRSQREITINLPKVRPHKKNKKSSRK